jgi:hypothetical protein
MKKQTTTGWSKRMIPGLLCFLALGFSGAVAKPGEQVENPAPQSPSTPLAMEQDFSIAVMWEGRQVGNLVLAAGTPLELTRIENGMLVCRHKNQQVRIPSNLTNFDPAIHQAAPPALKKETLTATSADPTPPAPPEDWRKLVDYAERQRAFTRQSTPAMRYQQYSFHKAHSPDAVRMSLQRVQKDSTLTPEQKDFANEMQVAFGLYRRGLWSEFETSVRIALHRLTSG